MPEKRRRGSRGAVRRLQRYVWAPSTERRSATPTSGLALCSLAVLQSPHGSRPRWFAARVRRSPPARRPGRRGVTLEASLAAKQLDPPGVGRVLGGAVLLWTDSVASRAPTPSVVATTADQLSLQFPCSLRRDARRSALRPVSVATLTDQPSVQKPSSIRCDAARRLRTGRRREHDAAKDAAGARREACLDCRLFCPMPGGTWRAGWRSPAPRWLPA